MSVRNLNRFSGVILLTLPLALAGCGTFSGGSERLRAPNYASPVGLDKWEVNCGRNRIIVDDDHLDQFYEDDGTAKSYTEFCEDAEPGRAARR
ncbi:hypothetical protein ACXYTJ_01715 [Gilvimarinus sp. F26214L]|uniref:hypothetical protein n=1 Tax=Gilvimarinus sp. DZF01 TaxID=3461371 RepID=UPI0040463377